ncbi:hypothetical protein AAC387_Pa05g0160 [Persea americana]
MAEIARENGWHERSLEEGVVGNAKDGGQVHAEHENPSVAASTRKSTCLLSVPFLQKLIAEAFGTYFVVFAVGHISGAHFNPAVTIAFATCKRFPWIQVPAYLSAQILGATLASGTLRLLFDGKREHFPGTIPSGSNLQSLVLEFIITFYLMFVISGVATDNRAIGELAGLAVGATVLLNVLLAGPISGASMNPARSLGPAIVASRYESIWVYIVGTICGAVSGAWAYNLIRFTNKPLREITKTGSFLRSIRSGSQLN